MGQDSLDKSHRLCIRKYTNDSIASLSWIGLSLLKKSQLYEVRSGIYFLLLDLLNRSFIEFIRSLELNAVQNI